MDDVLRTAAVLLGCVTLILATPIASADQPVAAFLGDSYTAGAGASPGPRWTVLVSRQMGWSERNFGRGGTGYLESTRYDANYVGRIDEVVDSGPAVVVVSGGLNDLATFAYDPTSVVKAVNDTYMGLRRRLPNAEIVAVGPSTTTAVAPVEDALRLDAAVEAAAASAGAEYVSLLVPHPAVSENQVVADGIHVDSDGHAAIANRVVSALR